MNVSQGPAIETNTRILTPIELAERIRMRLPSIKSAVRVCTANGELADYDDELANSLHYAVEFLETAVGLLSTDRERG